MHELFKNSECIQSAFGARSDRFQRLSVSQSQFKHNQWTSRLSKALSFYLCQESDYYETHYVEIKRARLHNRSQSRARSHAIDGIHDRDRLYSGILLKCLNRSGYQSIAFGIIIMTMFVIAIDYADYMRP